jgi:hypothetical protein
VLSPQSGHSPQSSGHVTHDSVLSQKLLPQPMHWPQSTAQLSQFSPKPQTMSPQKGSGRSGMSRSRPTSGMPPSAVGSGTPKTERPQPERVSAKSASKARTSVRKRRIETPRKRSEISVDDLNAPGTKAPRSRTQGSFSTLSGVQCHGRRVPCPISVMPRVFSLAAFALLLVACATRSVASHTPPRSAASEVAPEASAAVLTTSLTGDPPLPGEPSAGWVGLEPAAGAAAAAADPHAGHRGHGGAP